jgi:hypothetical protein
MIGFLDEAIGVLSICRLDDFDYYYTLSPLAISKIFCESLK